jgi:osmotically-inducible protein OsmY
VHVFGGQVRLEGRVPERKTARAIKEIAARCAGVRSVDERLQVGRARRRSA